MLTFTFNPQWLDERNKRSTKNEFKRVSNVWSDIEQVFRPERTCRRPMPLIARLIKAHSNEGELVVDFFSGYGTTGIVAHNLGRKFLGCEAIEEDAVAADRRVTAAKENYRSRAKAPTSGAHVVPGKTPRKTSTG